MTLQVFRLRDGSLEAARDNNWALEREIQSLCERNLKSLFGLQFVDSKGAVEAPTAQRHLEGKPPEIKELYQELRTGLLSFHPDVRERAIIVAILFEFEGSRFAEIVPQKKQLVIHFDYYDGNSRGLVVRDLKEEGTGRYWAVGNYQVKIKPGDNLSDVLDLLRASFDGLAKTS